MSIQHKIESLLTKAESTDNPAEAEIFAAKAFELMEKHGLEGLKARGTDSTREGNHVSLFVRSGPYAVHWTTFVNRISKAFDCTIVYTNTYERTEKYGDVKARRIDIFGAGEKPANAKTLIESLRLQMAGHMKTVKGFDQRSTQAERRGFIIGFAEGLTKKMAASRSEFVKEQKQAGTDLLPMLLNDRKIGEVALAKRFPNVGRGTSSSASVGAAGYNQGFAKGQAANTNTTAITGGRLALGK